MVFYDETTDSAARNVCVIAISVVPPAGTDIQPHLAEIIFEKEHLDQSLVVEHILECLADYSIRLRDVVGYGTDNVGYMLASYKNSLKQSLRNCVHLSCMCHIINLVIKDLTKNFEQCITWAQRFPSYFSHSGVRRRRYLDFVGQSGYRKQLAPSPVETRWTSYFECMTYHAEFLNVEKAFLASEAIDIVDSDTLEDLREFLSSNFKLILLECKFISERVKPLIFVLKIFESNLGITSLMQGLIDCVKFHLDSQLRFYDDSVAEIINTMSETFTTGEKKQFKERVTASSQKANAKFRKYFDEECGLHPARKFIYEAQFLKPKTAVKFHVRPEFNAIPGFSEIPDSEFSGYRLLCREYSSPSGNEFTLEDLRTEAQSIKDFWDGSGANLPILSKIGRTYGFLVGSSSCVERIFTYYNKVLSADRASLNSETIKQLMFLYCNSDLN